MPAGPCNHPYDTIAQKWSDFAERRRAYFIELYRSGRWKHYYNEEQFIARMRDVVRGAEIWADLAGAKPAPGDGLHPLT